jgi:hypothetical protein
MAKLIKGTSSTPIHLFTHEIQLYLSKNKAETVIQNAFGKISNGVDYIPQNFVGNIIFISYNSFQQNNQVLSNKIRRYVLNIIIKELNKISDKSITCIGGESYIYGLLTTKDIYHYTNSQSIYNDCNYNNKIYRRNISNNLVNYSEFKLKTTSNILLLNLAGLNINLINEINKSTFNTIIIINCHQDDFWKKTKVLSNFKLINREKFICWDLHYFITVSIFKRKRFVSLGSNCAVAYQLQQFNWRHASFPFDWSRIKLSQLITVLENNFHDYENLEIKKISENHLDFISGKPSIIYKNSYGIEFAHYYNFHETLPRRIDRFNKLINPTFIRIETGKITENIQELYNKLITILNKTFNTYEIIVVSIDKIKNPKVINRSLKSFENDWRNPQVNWKELFMI